MKGAEARVEIDGETVNKKRVQKEYRHPELDARINTERTRLEARLIRRASREGVAVPDILQEDDRELKMEKIEGPELRENMKEDFIVSMGENVARLHEGGIVHGDLTTRNVICSDQAYLIDFGLAKASERSEDRAMDLHLFRQILESQHPEKAPQAWESFMRGYRSFPGHEEVESRLKEVEERGRYK